MIKAFSPIPLGFIYAGISIVAFFGALVIDPFSVFSVLYAWVFVILPTLIIPAVLILYRVKHKRWSWVQVIIGSLMIVGVSFCHISLIAAASASV